MPKELRKIIFNDAELRTAVYDYCLRNSVNIPSAPMEGLTVSGNAVDFLVMGFTSDDLSDPREVPLSQDQVGAALIKYCSANNIPLPRIAQKILKAEGQEVAMLVHIHSESKEKPDTAA